MRIPFTNNITSTPLKKKRETEMKAIEEHKISSLET
jgi:hypothetical protein